MQDFTTRLKIMPAIVAASVLFAVGCERSAPPPSPPTSTPTSAEEKDFSSQTRSKSEELDESKDDEEEEEEEEEEEASDFNFGGAEFGEKEAVEEVKKCVDDGKFFNRFDEEEAIGKCTKLSLAKVDCELKGLKKVLSDKQLKQLNKVMSDDSSTGYKGWTIDQCLDCKKGSDEDLCKSSSGKEQVGTKVFFLKENDSELTGKSMLLPVRPGQGKD